MSDVSTRTWSLFQAAIDEGLLTEEGLLAGLELDRSVLRTLVGRIPWSAWIGMCERLVAAVPLDRIGQLAIRADIMGPLRTLSSSVASPRDLYAYGVRFVGPVIYRPVDFDVEDVGSMLRVSCRIHDGFAGCRAWVDMTTTAAAALPAIIGLPAAAMRVEHASERGFSVLLQMPPSMTLRSRLLRAWRSFRGGTRALRGARLLRRGGRGRDRGPEARRGGDARCVRRHRLLRGRARGR